MSQAALPKIRGTQVGLRKPNQVDRIKEALRTGAFMHAEMDNRIAGLRDRLGVYYVKEGHHRMAAAQELYRETGNPEWILELIRWGFWSEVDEPPNDWRPMPARNWWGSLRNWLGL